MLAKRIIPCLDVMGGKVVKGVRFRDHEVVGDIVELARRYRDEGADELVFYDITASSEDRQVDASWVGRVAAELDIPFCVAGGIRSVKTAGEILAAGADKISINSPALENPNLISELAKTYGQQCVVIGIDSQMEGPDYVVYQYTGNPDKTISTSRRTLDWVRESVERGAGEIVLNCMNQDGVRQGYDIVQLSQVRTVCPVPLVASGGAGRAEDFVQVFQQTEVDGALAASVFHKNLATLKEIKAAMANCGIPVRI